MKKCKVGILGVGRGMTVWNYCKIAENAEVVAVCDSCGDRLENAKKNINSEKVTFYNDYDRFLGHDMDVVILANYANEHAPFAIKAMQAGKNVISEVLPVETMAEAVALIECIEQTGKKYCYAENYCFMGAPREMKAKYLAGELGTFEYGEGEYLHNCEPIWERITYGERDHWRNQMSAFFYCTHSVGPLLHITGMKPVKVTGFECPFNERMARMGARAGHTAIEMVTLENGAIIKSIHGVGCSKCSVWYSIYGSKGRIESAREDASPNEDGNARVYCNLDTKEGVSEQNIQTYIPTDEQSEKAQKYGHGGSDYYCLYNAFNYILGDENADIVDVYEALDMWMCGFWGYISVLDGGVTKAVPDMRKPEVRDQYRNDNRCTNPKVAGDQLLPSYSLGTPDVPDEVYETIKKRYHK